MAALVSVEEEQQHRYGGFIGLILGLAVGAIVLEVAAGPPHLPSQLPSWQVIGSTLRGSSLPLGVLAYLLSTVAWAVWFWIVASILLRLLLAGADAVAHGVAWVQLLLRVSDRVTLPIVRRLVDGVLLTVFVVNVVGRAAPGAVAAAPPATATPHIATVRSHRQGPESTAAQQRRQKPQDIEYTVQSGDTLWGIAERFYGTGYEFPRLVTANVGRQMPDGQRFTQAGVIQPGWILRVPLPNQAVEEKAGKAYYVVGEGDTLRGIAARLLGSEDRWTLLFDVNRDKARIDGHVLTDPDLIWPGLPVRVPLPLPEAGGQHSRITARHPTPPTRPRHRVLSPTPVEPTSTPIPPSPTPRPTATVSTPVAIPTSHRAPEQGPGFPDGTALIEVVTGAAAAAAAGGAVVLARRRVRRSLDEPPIPTPKPSPPIDEFAETEPARMLRLRLQGNEAELVVLVAERIHRFLTEHGFGEMSIVMARQGQNTVTLLLNVGLPEQSFLQDHVSELGVWLGGKCHVSSTADHDIALQASGLKRVDLLAPLVRQPAQVLPLVPVGLLSSGEMLHANWRQLGHVLVAGLPGGGADVILTSLLATLTARYRPDELRLWMIAEQRTLPSSLARLPHQCSGFIDPSNETRVREALATMRAELARRMREAEGDTEWQPSRTEPELVLVVGELGDMHDDGTTLEMIGTHGPAHGVRLLAGTTHATAVRDALLCHFSTRFVLQSFDDDESIQLLGRPEAADLGSGEFFLRINRREPIRVRGLCVAPEHLDELVRLMHEVYGSVTPTVWPTNREADAGEVQASPALDEEPLPCREDGIAQESDAAPHQAQERAVVSVAEPEGEAGQTLQDDATLENAIPCVEAVPQVTLGSHVVAEQPATDEPHTQLVEERGAHANVGVSSVETPEPGSLVQVRCFGEFSVWSAKRELTPYLEEGPSYKAWELLAFLASQPGGTIARDKLLAALWPDADEERGANRMRVAMARLRTVLARQIPDLPPEVVRTDREGMCRLDTALVTSDVHQFLTLLEAASTLPTDQARMALEQARALYIGDLLSSRGARLYDWVDERDESGVSLREHYREQYFRATQRQARLWYQAGRADLAVPLYREILAAEPTLEDVVRELYRCYQQLGDITSLIREDRHLRQGLREMYSDADDSEVDPNDYQPEAETVMLFNEIRQDLQARLAGADRVRADC